MEITAGSNYFDAQENMDAPVSIIPISAYSFFFFFSK